MAKKIILLFCPMIILLTASCSQTVPRAEVLTGNLAYSRGNYQNAIIGYLTALHSDMPSQDVVKYNLGNVYYALGEGKAAMGEWDRAEKETEDTDILFRIAFNRGLLFYNWGRYQEAYLSFKQALRINPANLDAKINLEESWSRIPLQPPANTASGTDVTSESDSGYSSILEYIELKEASQWQQQDANTGDALNDW